MGPEQPAPYLGILVSKETLDVAVGADAAIWTVPDTLKQVAECVTWLQRRSQP